MDDEDMVLEVGREILERLRYKAMVAASGRAAINVCRTHPDRIGLVILDLNMPDMAGVETYDRFKAENPDIVVLLSIGYSIDRQATDVLKHGCNGFIQKPFSVDALSQKIREILR